MFHYLTNSLPHTSAGYSLRSHAVLQCMQSAGIQVAAATRYGYPNIVGKLAAGEHERVDSIDYFRMLPLWPSNSFFTQQDRAVRQLVRYAGKFGAEALHTTTGFENALIVSRAAKRLGIPWVYEMRGAPEQTWLSKQPTDKRETAKDSEYYQGAHCQELEAARQAAAVVVLSEITKRSLIEHGISAEKIVVAPNGVPDDAFQQFDSKLELRRELHLPEDKTLVGAITAVVDYEGLEYFLEALTKLDESFLGVVVGDGVALEGLKEQAQSLGIEQRVRFVGRQPASSIHKWYGALDVFVVPRKDTVVCRNVTPIKSVMAQALDIPVVASDLPALHEVTGGIETYVEPENAMSLAEGIRFAERCAHDKRRTSWARTRAWSAVAHQYSTLYK
ncbi:glycosyltransferase family 4 protein [Corynebacterium pseudogenitalium]|uniref:glycosyltransferase family 4 protein n=1 Tax=Corynebacterium pseudogenitalium TaxID=38303 RepID=UPI003BA094D7